VNEFDHSLEDLWVCFRKYTVAQIEDVTTAPPRVSFASSQYIEHGRLSRSPSGSGQSWVKVSL
jgi:hypothetical protein